MRNIHSGETRPVFVRVFAVLATMVALLLPSMAHAQSLAISQVFSDGVDGVDGLAGCSGVAVSPDGRHVYATGNEDHAVALFVRDESSGWLSFVEAVYDGQDGFENLGRAWGITLSRDGKQVYVAAEGSQALTVLSRDVESGRLTYLESHVHGVDGVSGLYRPRNMTWSLDGRFLYAHGAVFQRDSGTGRLTLVEPLPYPGWGLDVSPDDRHLYVAGGHDVYHYRRSISTGAATLVDTYDCCIDTGEHYYENLVVAPDGAYLYALRPFSMDVYRRDTVTGALTLSERPDPAPIACASVDLSFASDSSTAWVVGFSHLGGAYRDPASGYLFPEGCMEFPDVFLDIALAPGEAHAYAAGQGGALLVLDTNYTPPAHMPLAWWPLLVLLLPAVAVSLLRRA